MRNSKRNIYIGLTMQEFELVITNSNNPEFIKGYVNKLDNCDLSRSAIELIKEDDLAALNRITNEVLLSYPSTSKNKKNLLLLIGSIVLSSLIIIVLFFRKDIVDSTFYKRHNIQNFKTSIQPKLHKNNLKTSLPKGELVTSLVQDSIVDKTTLSDSLSGKVNKLTTVLSKNNTPHKKTKKSKKSDYKRTVKSIKCTKKVPYKYTKEKFYLDDLVDFDGGNENLNKILQKKIEIKDQQVPQKNTSIIFKFSVTPKGKIKDINILSRVDLELEEIIKEAILGLKTWKEGNKSIPVIYTIYITYN